LLQAIGLSIKSPIAEMQPISNGDILISLQNIFSSIITWMPIYTAT